jgi:hypothetical protein
MKSYQLQQTAGLITTAVIALCVAQSSLAQSIYQVGVPVCDTIQTGLIAHSNTPGGCDYPEDYFEFIREPYATGLSFQMIITETSGRVWSNLSDSVKVGDVFTIPEWSGGDTLRIFFRVYSSFGFITRIVGTPTVAYESYPCSLWHTQTTQMCNNIYAYVGKPDDGFCQVQPTSSVEEKGDGSLPVQFQLRQNYPNPFNASTNIEFDLPRATEVSLKVFTLHGEEVAAVLDQSRFAAGSHRINWNVENLPSGIYVYCLQTNDGFVAMRKLVLLK